ncbi:MAG TPA: cysteine peptidase family C39 domain-containing protein [Armatimonadota bacterium]|nr:cysteine peptidase family C39 domain-containing protein [Armatimonadota bacterium]
MFWNPYAVVALVGGLLCYSLGHRIAMRQACRWGWLVCSVLCLPALSFNMYYAHLWQEPWWYIEFRSVPGIEMLAACWGCLFGLACSCLAARQDRVVRVACHTLAVIVTLLFVAIPFLKPVLNPVESTRPLVNHWRGKACLQTSGATCGPASLATIFAYYGIAHSEREIARACYTSFTGTELWYVIRYARAHGLHVRNFQPHTLAEIPAPSLVGTTPFLDAGPVRAGHFITVLGKTAAGYQVADPECGCRTLSEQQFYAIYGRICDAVYFSR